MSSIPPGTNQVWLRTVDRARNPGYRHAAHLDMTCRDLTKCCGVAHAAAFELLSDRSYQNGNRITWFVYVKVFHIPVGLRDHFVSHVCAKCLRRALDQGLIPTPPLPVWARRVRTAVE